MTIENTDTHSPETQSKPWLGRIIKTGIIFSCGVITGAVIESMLNDRLTSNSQTNPDKEDDGNTEAEVLSVENENEDIDGEADIPTKIGSWMFGDLIKEDDGNTEAEVLSVENENEDIDGKADIPTKPESEILGNLMNPISPLSSTPTIPEDGEAAI